LPKDAYVIPQLDTVELENMTVPPLTAADQEAKNEKYRNLRRLLCTKPEMLIENGDLDLEYVSF
jgi:tmRNA-binding protein